MELRHVLVIGEGGRGAGRTIVDAAIVKEFEAEEATAERGRGVGDAAGLLHVLTKIGRGGEGDEEAGGGEFFAKTEHGIDVALAREADEEDMGKGIHGGSHLLFC